MLQGPAGKLFFLFLMYVLHSFAAWDKEAGSESRLTQAFGRSHHHEAFMFTKSKMCHEYTVTPQEDDE